MRRQTALTPEQRRAQVLELSRHSPLLSVEAIAGRFAVSRETARRDLGVLEHRGLIRRTHGGAASPRIADEAPFRERQSINTEAKRAIAVAAAALFRKGETLMIDTGSTTEAFAAALSAVPGVVVVTNSVRIASAMSSSTATNVVGGVYQQDTGQMLGSRCIEQLRTFHADHAVLGIGAISARGEAMDYDPEEAQCARAMIAQSNCVTLLADQSKFGRSALASVCAASRIDRIVTNLPLPPAMMAMFDKNRVEIIVAEATAAQG